MGVLAETLQGPEIVWSSLSPLLVLLGGTLFLLLVGALTPQWPRHLYGAVSAATGLGTIAAALALWHRVDVDGPSTLVADAARLDHTTLWITIVIAAAVTLVSLTTSDYLVREGQDAPEIYALFLMSAIGGVTMAAANDFVVLFLGLEILSIALYVLAASHRRRVKSQESGLKYFVLGGFSSAVFLYGAALIYGATGSTNFTRISETFSSVVDSSRRHEALALAGVALLSVGLMFKVAAVPFHFWTPDVYEGAPTPVTAFMASAAKAAAFAALLRVLVSTLPQWADDARPVVWALCALTLVGGSTMAVVQTNVKRMLAFSSVSHAGFMLVGVEAALHISSAEAGTGHEATMMYALLYAVLVIGTFAVVSAVSRTGDGATDLAGFRGLGRTNPVLALSMTVLLLAQAGVPLTSGFIAKFGVIGAAVRVHSYAIAIIAMVSAVIAAYLYLRIMISMWVAEPESGDDSREDVRVGGATRIVIAASVGFTLLMGVAPGLLLDLVP